MPAYSNMSWFLPNSVLCKEVSNLPDEMWQYRLFIKELEKLRDRRDNRGKRHSLPFVLCSVTLAILSGRAELSSIQRFIANRIKWLREVTQEPNAGVISRSQLPRILSGIDRKALNRITMGHFGINILEVDDGEWVSIDGKALRGTPDDDGTQKVRILTAVKHDNRDTIALAEMNSAKKGEITAVRAFLEQTDLAMQNLTLDALHLNPKTTALIAQAQGQYIIQLKRNQDKLCRILTEVAHTRLPLATVSQQERGHGRHEERTTLLFDIQDIPFDERWQQSNFRTLAVVIRQTISTKNPDKISQELSFYLSNSHLDEHHKAQHQSIHQAIRFHWGVEVVNWIRDVTFQEDYVHTKDSCMAQTLAIIRTFAIRLLQKHHIPNFKAALETFSDSPPFFNLFLQFAKIL